MQPPGIPGNPVTREHEPASPVYTQETSPKAPNTNAPHQLPTLRLQSESSKGQTGQDSHGASAHAGSGTRDARGRQGSRASGGRRVDDDRGGARQESGRLEGDNGGVVVRVVGVRLGVRRDRGVGGSDNGRPRRGGRGRGAAGDVDGLGAHVGGDSDGGVGVVAAGLDGERVGVLEDGRVLLPLDDESVDVLSAQRAVDGPHVLSIAAGDAGFKESASLV